MYGPEVRSLPEIAKATKIPLRTVKTIYNRGLAAWRTGHRPGASPQAWGYARVHSFATKGKTYYTADADLRKN
jgi:DNA-directed RNA polymerase specialized sigma24 family protein